MSGYCCTNYAYNYCSSSFCASGCCGSSGTCAVSYLYCSSSYVYTNGDGAAIVAAALNIVAIIVGTIIGVQFLAALIFFLCWFFKRRARLAKIDSFPTGQAMVPLM